MSLARLWACLSRYSKTFSCSPDCSSIAGDCVPLTISNEPKLCHARSCGTPRDNDADVKRSTVSTSALSSNLQSVCLGVASRVQLDATQEAMSTLAMSRTLQSSSPGLKTKEHANDAETETKAVRPSRPESADDSAHRRGETA